MPSLHHHCDSVAAADGLVDLLRGVHLHSVYLHHNISWQHTSSETSTTVLWVSRNTHSTRDPSPLIHTHGSVVCSPVGRRAHDHFVDQDAVCHVWEGRVSQLKLGNDAEAKGPNRNTPGFSRQLCCDSPWLSFTAGISDCEAFTSALASASLLQCTAAWSLTHQTKSLKEDVQKQDEWK